MNGIRFGRGQGYQFFRQEEVRRNWDLRSATHFLDGFRADAVAMSHFRRQIKKEITAGAASLSDEQIVQSLARMLVSGEFMVAMPERLQHRDPIDLGKPEPAPSQPKPGKPVEVVEDEPTFQGGHDGVAQAAVLIAAARGGFPFCEECARHAAQQAAGPSTAKQTPAPQTAGKSTTTTETATLQKQTPAATPSGQTPPAGLKQDTTPPPAPPAPPKPEAPPSAAAQPTTPTPVAKQETPAPAKLDTPAPAPPAETKTLDKETYWVEIALIDEDGKSVPGEEYAILLPDGRRVTGKLDGEGLARISELPDPGTCKVSFSQLDKDAWQPVSPGKK